MAQVDTGRQQRHAEQQPSDRVGEVLRQRHAESKCDGRAGGEEVGDLDVQQQKQQDHAAGRQQRRRPRQRWDDLVVRAREPPGCHQHRRAGDDIRIEIPVEHARAARFVDEHGGVQREPHEDDSQERDAPQQQSPVRNAAIDPGERGTFERPADCDPLVMELERNRDGGERQRGARDDREPAEVARARRLEPQQHPQQ